MHNWSSTTNKAYYRVRGGLAAGRARLRELESGVRRRRLSRNVGAERGDAPIFFIVGRGRSGTNWLMRTLDCHPEVMCSGEGRFFGRGLRHESLKEMQTTEHMKHKLQPASLYNALAESEYLRLWIERSVWTRDGDVEKHVERLVRAAVYHFLTEKLSESGKRMVGDKTPLVSQEVVEEIARICPEAKVIHIIRDGRDVAVSMTHFLWNRATDVGGVYELSREERERRDHYWENPRRFVEHGGEHLYGGGAQEDSPRVERYSGRNIQEGA